MCFITKAMFIIIINFVVVLGSISFLLLVYGITNSERYSVFYGIWSSKIAQGKLYR